MDLETENRLAAMLVEEARRLQAQADKEGVLAYLHRPNVRVRPNSRFLTATVLGVEQANRVVEVNEMWRAREKEKEIDVKLKRKMKNRELDDDDKHISNSNRSVYSSRHEQHYRNSKNPSSSKRGHDYEEEDDDGLRDDELEEFLRSRAKRGRGDIGPRMDEPGPYLSAPLKSDDYETREKEDWERRIVGPQKLHFIKSHDSLHEYIQASDSLKKKQHTKEKRKSSKDEGSDKKKRQEKKKKSKHRCHKKHRSRSDSE